MGKHSADAVSEAKTAAARMGAGPVLNACEAGQAVLEALLAANRDLSVLDRGSYWRISAPGGCKVTRAAIEKKLGRAFRLPMDLEAMMPSFTGRFQVDEDSASWEAA